MIAPFSYETKLMLYVFPFKYLLFSFIKKAENCLLPAFGLFVLLNR